MNAYLFSAGVSQTQVRAAPGRPGQTSLQSWDTCVSAIVYGGEREQAQKAFEAGCHLRGEGENPVQTEIKRIVGAQLIDQLLTESGGRPLDWPQISQQLADTLQATALDDFEQGYWVDVNVAVPPGRLSFDVDSLKRDLPEDIRSGLNWSPERKFFFLVSVLSPPPPPPDLEAEFEAEATNPDEADEEDAGDTTANLDQTIAALPEMRDKEAAALVEARNSVVAAWLWRRFAADTRLAANEIQISPLCAFWPVE